MARKTGKLYEEDNANFVKNKASKWTKSLSAVNNNNNNNNNNDNNSEHSASPLNDMKTITAENSAPTKKLASLIRGAPDGNTQAQKSSALPPLKETLPQNDLNVVDTSVVDSLINIPEGSELNISASQDIVQTIFKLRGSLKQQVETINMELALLDSQILKMVKTTTPTSSNNNENQTNNAKKDENRQS